MNCSPSTRQVRKHEVRVSDFRDDVYGGTEEVPQIFRVEDMRLCKSRKKCDACD
jgi:hypothetical protein